MQTFIADLETAAQTKDADGKTSLNRILEGFTASASSSIQQGFSARQDDKTKAQLAVTDKLRINGVKNVDGAQKHRERVTGTVRNDSDQTITNIRFNVVLKDAAGALIDVSAGFSRLQGTLKPGDELGFEVRRDLGGFREDDDVLAARKAATAAVSITNLPIVE